MVVHYTQYNLPEFSKFDPFYSVSINNKLFLVWCSIISHRCGKVSQPQAQKLCHLMPRWATSSQYIYFNFSPHLKFCFHCSYKDAWPIIIIRYRVDSIGSIQGPMVNFCDHGKESLCSVKTVNAFNTSATTYFQERPLTMVTEMSIHAK